MSQSMLRANLNEQEWYILKDNNSYGPFTQLDLANMLKSKSLTDFDFIWKDGIKNWVRINTLPEFSPENIETMTTTSDKLASKVFFERRSTRFKFGGSIIIHNNQNVFKGRSIELSQDGAGIYIDSSLFILGQILFLHFKPGDGVPAFNADCTVVSKEFSAKYLASSGQEIQEFRYGVRFERLEEKIKSRINQLAISQKSNK